MDKEAEPKADVYDLVAWAHAHRKRLIVIAAGVLALGATIGIYVWRNNAREADANGALSLLPIPATVRTADAATVAGQYAQLADTYANTSAGARAMLIGGGLYFDAGEPAKAQALFERYLHEHADYPLTTQALVGLAACLDAEGKTADAISRYEEFLRTHPTDSAAAQVKAALARLYAAQNKPDRALHLYQDLFSLNNSSWASEAQIQAAELLGSNPDLRKPPPTSTTNEALMIPGDVH